MQSHTKSAFSPQTVAELVKVQLGANVDIAGIVPLTAGWFNTAYAIYFADHEPGVVLRIAPHPDQRVLTYERDLMRREVEIIKTVQDIEGLPVPALVGCDFSRRHLDRDHMFIEMLSGRPFNEIKRDLSEVLHLLVRKYSDLWPGIIG